MQTKLALAVVVLLALIAAACGGSDDDAGTDAAQPTEAPSDAVAIPFAMAGTPRHSR